MEGGGKELNCRTGRVTRCGDESLDWDGGAVCEVDCLSGQMVDILPMYPDLSRTDECIEVARVVVDPRGCSIPERTSMVH